MQGIPKLISYKFSNYLGADSAGIEVSVGEKGSIFCGENNSGKTTIVSILNLLRRIVLDMRESDPFSKVPSTLLTGRHSNLLDVKINLFHKHNERITGSFDFRIPWEYFDDYEQMGVIFNTNKDFNPDVHVGFDYSLSLQDGAHVFEINRMVLKKRANAGDENMSSVITIEQSGLGNYREINQQRFHSEILKLLRSLFGGIVTVPSWRRAVVGSYGPVENISRGIGLVSWIKQAASPNTMLKEDISNNSALKEFEREFAEFIDAEKVEFSVDSAETLNVSYNGLLIPVTNLGAGIEECLLILLLSKLFSKKLLTTEIHILVLEEPELHLHPRLQQLLMSAVNRMGIQTLITTHSPTVLRASMEGRTLYRTKTNKDRSAIELLPISGDPQVRELISEGLGMSPGDLLQADMIVWVEGPTDIGVFQHWIGLVPNANRRNILVAPLGGNNVRSKKFDFGALKRINSNSVVILDSENLNSEEKVADGRRATQKSFRENGVECHLTFRNATESYFPEYAIAEEVEGFSPLGVSATEEARERNIFEFYKSKGSAKKLNTNVALRMEWTDLKETDIGAFLVQCIVGKR